MNNCFNDCCDDCCSRPQRPQCCCIGPTGPMGPIGPIGPTGATGVAGPTGATATNTNAFLYQPAIQTVTAGSDVALTLSEIYGTDIIQTSPTVTTLAPGVYSVVFKSLIASPAGTGTVGATLELNGVAIPTGSAYITVTDTGEQLINIPAIIDVAATSTLEVTNGSGQSLTYDNSNLSIIELV